MSETRAATFAGLLVMCGLVFQLVTLSSGFGLGHGAQNASHHHQQDEQPVRYDGYQVWRVVPKTEVEVKQLNLMRTKYDVSFWRLPSSPGRPVDVMVPPSLVSQLAPVLKEGFPASFQILQSDVQLVIDQQEDDRAKPDDATFAYDKYHPLEEVEAWIEDMARIYPSLASKDVIGKSYEGRSMHYLKISTGDGNRRNHGNSTGSGKRGIFIQGGIHAREWISPATVIYMTNQLLKQYGTDTDTTTILDAFDWYILPVFNVDGYKFTWGIDRLWRKTRSPTSIKFPLCRGTDPNRNWDNHWGGEGSSGFPCSETYRGSKPFSEVEVKSVADFLLTKDFAGFIDFHSYSQLWMTPWGWTTDLPKDFDLQDAQSEACVKAVEAVHGTPYTHGSIANTIYPADGNSVDWAYENAGVLLAATVELRDRGRYGFLLPANQIVPSGEETLAGLKQYALFIINNQQR